MDDVLSEIEAEEEEELRLEEAMLQSGDKIDIGFEEKTHQRDDEIEANETNFITSNSDVEGDLVRILVLLN